jgi:glycosyltransferase involved in cell wall biosynthesis
LQIERTNLIAHKSTNIIHLLNSTKMKVLYVLPSLSPLLGGPTHVALNLSKTLRDQGIDIEIATTNHDGKGVLDVPLYQRVEYQQVPTWFFPKFGPPLKEFICAPTLTQWLWQHLREYDLLETHYLFSYAPSCAAAIAYRQKIPYAMRTMGQLTPWALAQSATKKKLYTQLIERRNLQRAALIHCTAPEEAADVRAFGIQTPTVTLPLGVTPPPVIPDAPARLRQAYGIAKDIPILLFLSRLHYKKRPELLLQAVHHLTTQQHPCHVILAGSGEDSYLADLTQLVASLGLQSQVSFAGFVTGIDKHLLLQGSNAFVLPSYSENFGVVVAEALIAELPVVITPGVQISAEIAAAKAGLVVEGEVMALAQVLRQLLNTPALQDELRKNGLRLAQERYAWPAIVRALTLAYEAAIEKQKTSQIPARR